ncbi:FUSC family protein [Nonomuraea wenchangensis]|uniref:Aromatic acid exporter family member 1 n=1 Tax=Nonomuraea wenchangensis TaxID=568860 RepID=A0A1I0KJV4_9ACTN|nr:aromatic acid exporter family protein [Nonomuraea wenchangensis]SEU24257.1 Aromatic acid exporter family member 1 [Nonomuraea wenchangensis]
METEPGRGRDDRGSPLGRIMRGGAAALANIHRHGLRRWLAAEREELIQTIKVTVACVFGWWLAAYVLKVDLAVLVPIGVLLTISATAYDTVIRGVQQVGAVFVGMAAATTLIWLIGVNALTLGVLVLAGLVLTRLLNLPERNVQIPITALLVLALGKTYGFARLGDVLLGAVIGIAANLILPPRFVDNALRELGDLSGELSELAQDMADGLRSGLGKDVAEDWLERARDLSRRLEQTEQASDQAEESVRLSPRRRRYDRRLRQVSEAATCLDHACHQLRGVARGLADLVSGVRGLPAQEAAEVPRPLAEELDALSRLFGTFGRLQLGRGREEDLRELRAALREGERQQHVSLSMFGRTRDDRLRTLQGSLLEDCARIRHEFDPDHGPHRDAFPRPPARRSGEGSA